MIPLTSSQAEAVAATGNVLVAAGAGTGKTRTLTERCLRLVQALRVPLERILVVTFTEAAALEMRDRIRAGLARAMADAPEDAFLAEQMALLECAPISTLDAFCLRLVRDHFHELGLDPDISVLDETQATPLRLEVFDSLWERHCLNPSPENLPHEALVANYGRDAVSGLRELVWRIHLYTQTLPNPETWIAEMTARWGDPEPTRWRNEWVRGFLVLAADWIETLEAQSAENLPAHRCARVLAKCADDLGEVGIQFDTQGLRSADDLALAAAISPKALQTISEALAEVEAADDDWPKRAKTRLRAPIKVFFEEASFLASLGQTSDDRDPLSEDWAIARRDTLALLFLVREFAEEFSRTKRNAGGLEFADLQQLALRLLIDDRGGPSAIATECRARFDYLLIDEYQDINAAQDAFLAALSRDGAAANRFLVGDVKQSIYRFRRANPEIFRQYHRAWNNGDDRGRFIAMRENFRSRENLLAFINSLFGFTMRPAIGGMAYGPEEALQSGGGKEAERAEEPSVELHLLALSKENAENDDAETSDEETPNSFGELIQAEKEARWIGLRLLQLREEARNRDDAGQPPFAWGEVAILLRSPRGRVESYAKEFARLGIPLAATRSGFFDALEILDLLNLLRLLDNPLRDIPLLAVLRSPLVGFSLSELAEIRASQREALFWTALHHFHRTDIARGPAWAKTDLFLKSFARWRDLARERSLSDVLESILAATFYEALLQSEPHGMAKLANVRKFQSLALRYDPYQRQGLSRFLGFVESQIEAGTNWEPAVAIEEEAVRLISIHQSKGLEFRIVVVADLAKTFNLESLRGDILLDERLGLCPRLADPESGSRYPSLPHWLAQRRERSELLGEEMRLLYVAMTRAREHLILSATEKKAGAWFEPRESAVSDRELLSARSSLDWIRLWFTASPEAPGPSNASRGQSPLLRWSIESETEALAKPPAESGPSTAESTAGTVIEDLASADVLAALRHKLSWLYPFLEIVGEPGKWSVSALRRKALDAEEAGKSVVFARGAASDPNGFDSALTASERGSAHHRFLQHFSLNAGADLNGLMREADCLVQARVLSPRERDCLDLPALTLFWTSEIGVEILRRREFVQRELPFTARFSIPEISQLLGADFQQLETEKPPRAVENAETRDEFVVVQGVIDLAVILPEAVWLIDFKTDRVTGASWRSKASQYYPQLAFYAKALEQVYRRPVTNRWLHFLAISKTVEGLGNAQIS